MRGQRRRRILIALTSALGLGACSDPQPDDDIGRGAVDETCPPTRPIPEASGCDSVSLLASEVIATQSEGITPIAGPDGTEGVRIGNAQSIDLRDDTCLQYGRDGSDFSLSLWFRVPDPGAGPQATLIGTGNAQGDTDGFALVAQPRGHEWEVVMVSGGGPGTPRTSTRFPYNNPQRIKLFDPTIWNHVVLTVRGSQARILVNGEHGDWEVPELAMYQDVYRPGMLRIGDPGEGEQAPVELVEVRGYTRALAEREARALYYEHISARGLSTSSLDGALERLTQHVQGQSVLAADAFDQAVAEVVRHAPLLPTTQPRIDSALQLIDLYEASAGPLFVTEATREIIQTPQDGEPDAVREARGMLAVHQAVFDNVFESATVAGCAEVLQQRGWQTSEHFPGATQPGAMVGQFTVQVDASKPAAFGRPVAFSRQLSRRPTGLYLPAGSVGRVTVPSAMVGRGYSILVGAHSHTQDNVPESTRAHRRLPGVSRRYEITSEITTIANPVGGGVYVEVPNNVDAGLVDVTIEGVVEAPLFSLRERDRMTAEQWRSRRTAPGPWADFITDRFMMQVPRHWVYAMDDPTSVMEDWDLTMDGFTEFTGRTPEERNDIVLYMQPDVWIRHNAGGIGYPQINLTYNPRDIRDGTTNNFYLTAPVNQLEMHELGHSQLFTMFHGEGEALVNFPMAYILNQKFGVDFDEAFARSGSEYRPMAGLYSPDKAAIHWMITENFRNGLEMDNSNTTRDQMRYQHRGYAKYADVARLFGWDALTGFFRQEHLDYQGGPNPQPTDLDAGDDRILRMSVAANVDLTPLIHFWGIHPVDPDALKDAVAARGLAASPLIEEQIRRYRGLIPADNEAFNANYEEIYPGRPETDPSVHWGHGWYNLWRDVWDETHAQQARDSLDAILELYYPQ
ncbi:MAG: M60 family metallopeptidase [Deltaproteobacteria bacterium]|nr:M60 family metallopeptidase [Deltaproteobacteria bacterium]